MNRMLERSVEDQFQFLLCADRAGELTMLTRSHCFRSRAVTRRTPVTLTTKLMVTVAG